MFFDPRIVVLLIILVAVSGWVARGLMASFFKLRRDDGNSSSLAGIEERLKRIEEATSGLIMDVTAMREKERFMARLQASASTHQAQPRHETTDGEPSPLVTQNIPVVPRVSR